MQSISVIIPTLNEAGGISRTLASVENQEGDFEIIVADGGSDDNTIEVIGDRAQVLTAPRGRAAQMNAGAGIAAGDILVFLHADTLLPENAFGAIREALHDTAAIGGCFRATFDMDGFWMRIWSWRIWMNRFRLAFGDRAQFVRKGTFEAVAGFPDQPLYEDLDLVQAIRKRGRFVFLEQPVVTSARRFRKQGALVQQLRNLGLWMAWLVGLSPAKMKRFYPDSPHERGVVT